MGGDVSVEVRELPILTLTLSKYSAYHRSSNPLARAINTVFMYIWMEKWHFNEPKFLITLEEVELRN